MPNNLGGNVSKFTRNLDKIIERESMTSFLFWCSDILTGSQTKGQIPTLTVAFWCSDILTGSQTSRAAWEIHRGFWSSDILTGSQTRWATWSHQLDKVVWFQASGEVG